jgi:hypothetical protein
MIDERRIAIAAMSLVIGAVTTSVHARPVDDRTAIDKAAGIEAPPEDAAAEEKEKEYTVVTGLDFAMWWLGDRRLAGPGLGIGFVLVPDRFEMTLSFGAMLGGGVYSVPVELSFEVPFRVAKALNLYVNLGPTLFVDKAAGELTHDFALSMGGGLELLPPKYDWGIYLEGDYNLHLQQHVDSQGGFSAGFRYRF